MADIIIEKEIMPDIEDAVYIVTAKLSYDTAKANKSPAEFQKWIEDPKRHFKCNPRGLAWTVGPRGHESAVKYATRKKTPVPSADLTKVLALRHFVLAVTIGWDDLAKALKQSLKFWKITSADMQKYMEVWVKPDNAAIISKLVDQAQAAGRIKLIEAVEKHETLNPKLFTKDKVLKTVVRKKMLEIVDEFLADLKEQDIKIKVDDILLIGSNASYNYTKDSDIDLHILADTRGTKYTPEVAAALYSAFRTLFNKQLDIKLYDIPVELFVETEDSPRASNGVYSVKKDNWVRQPVPEEIPEYDKEALADLVEKWETKCESIIADFKADKLKDETKVVKLLEEIYEKLRKKGVAKSEYSIENLAFKEIRNDGYLDDLKLYRNELISKRLSLQERLDRRAREDAYVQLTQAAFGNPPIIQDNGMFFIYNLKASEISRALSSIRQLPFVVEVTSYENGKYDMSNVMELAMNKIPSKYYDIRGKIDEVLC